MGAPPIYQFKCRHKDCIFRNTEHDPKHACDYAAMTGRTRTRRDKPANTAKCEFYVKRIAGYRRRGYSLTGPAWEQVALSLHHAGYDSAEIARIVGAAPEAVAKLIAQRAGRSPRPKTYLGEINTDKARALYEQGLSDHKMAEELGCSKSLVKRWRDTNGLPTKQTKGRGARICSAHIMKKS